MLKEPLTQKEKELKGEAYITWCWCQEVPGEGSKTSEKQTKKRFRTWIHTLWSIIYLD